MPPYHILGSEMKSRTCRLPENPVIVGSGEMSSPLPPEPVYCSSPRCAGGLAVLPAQYPGVLQWWLAPAAEGDTEIQW